MEHPDPKLHQLISFWKSGIRIGGSILTAILVVGTGNAVGGVLALSCIVLVAELLGVWEEFV